MQSTVFQSHFIPAPCLVIGLISHSVIQYVDTTKMEKKNHINKIVTLI